MPITREYIEQLDPRNDTSLKSALAFLRLVMRNNPDRPIEEIFGRPDTQSALTVVNNWISEAERTAVVVIAESPVIPAQAIADVSAEVEDTIAKLRRDTDVTEENRDSWREDTKDLPWIARIILRMWWLIQWLLGLVGVPLGALTKTWISRLAENTCRFCRALHGTTIPVGDSFAAYARRAGVKRVYGGLYAPPLHPRCQCRLRYGLAPADTSGGT